MIGEWRALHGKDPNLTYVYQALIYYDKEIRIESLQLNASALNISLPEVERRV